MKPKYKKYLSQMKKKICSKHYIIKHFIKYVRTLKYTPIYNNKKKTFKSYRNGLMNTPFRVGQGKEEDVSGSMVPIGP